MEAYELKLYSDVLFRGAKDIDKRGHPKEVPKDLVALYDSVSELNTAFCTKLRPEGDQHWIIIELWKFSKRLDRMEAKLTEKSVVVPAPTPDPIDSPAPIKRGPGRPRKNPAPVPAGVN